MDKKRFDHIEQQMRAASENWEPPFNEGAWEHMEQMLEGENERKRPVAWWLWLIPLFLLLGTGAYFMLRNNDTAKEDIAIAKEIPAGKTVPGRAAQPGSDISSQENSIPVESDPSSTSVTKPGNKAFVYTKQGSAKTGINISSTLPGRNAGSSEADAKKIRFDEKGKTHMNITTATTEEDEVSPKQPEEKYTKENSEPATSVKPDTEDKAGEPSTSMAKKVDSEEPLPAKASKAKTEKKKNRQPSKFYFSIAGGIEGNGVDFPGTHKFSARAGFLAGYQLTNKLSIQTGFFAGSKKYVAGKNDYKAKEGSYWSTVDITRVDANCRVFEIPLVLRYDFTPSRKWNLFAGAGLSSYIMDKEDYDYDYIRYSMPYHAKASYTGNRHFFSVLRISGGMERKLSEQFSLGINPGIAVPLAGVGDGQIKLFSTEVLLSLKYRPFKKSK